MSDTNHTLVHRLRNALEYDEKTGVFVWKEPVRRGRIRPDRVAGCLSSSNGYIYIRLEGRLLAAHRLAWLYVHGEEPNGDLDHIDGVRTNNSIRNLRVASQVLNQQNLKRAKSHSASGILGVCLDKRRGKWKAEIKANKVRKFLGYFETAELAHDAYLDAKRRLHAYNTL